VRTLRAAAAFLLGLHAVVHAGVGLGVLPLPLAAGLVAGASLLGLLGRGPTRGVVARDRAATYRATSLWSLYGLAVIGSFFLVGVAPAPVVSAAVQGLVACELAFLAWPAIGRGGQPLLVNSLALAALAGLAGPPFSSTALGGVAVLSVVLVVVDHHDERRAPARAALLPALGHAALATAVVVPLLRWLPARTSVDALSLGGGAASRALLPEDAVAAYGRLAFWALLGLVLIVALGRLLDRAGDDDEQAPDELRAQAEAGRPVDLAAWRDDLDVDLEGARGRVIRTFERFLARADRLGFARRPSWTPAEFARRLPAPAGRLARAFGLARYSVEALTDADAEEAAADAEAVLSRLRQA
jgi:hypothetical protein